MKKVINRAITDVVTHNFILCVMAEEDRGGICLQKTVLGIDIGNFNIKVVQAMANADKMEILNYAIARTPEGVLNDGKILDIDGIASQITEMLSKNFIRTKQAIGVISSSALITREVAIPKMSESDLAKYIKVDSQQYFPMDLEDYVLDFKLLGESIQKEGTELNVLLAAIPEIIVNDYIKVFDKLKLDVEAIDIIPNLHAKYSQYYLANKTTGSSTFAIIDMGANSTIVSIVSDGALQFNKMISTGANEITENIANTFNLSLNEAEEYKIKNAEIILESYNSEGLAGSISDVIKPAIDNIISQTNKFFEFYYSRNLSNKINGIYLVGGGALLKGIDKYFQGAFNITTRKADLTDGIVDRSNKPTAQRDMPIILDAFTTTFRE